MFPDQVAGVFALGRASAVTILPVRSRAASSRTNAGTSLLRVSICRCPARRGFVQGRCQRCVTVPSGRRLSRSVLPSTDTAWGPAYSPASGSWIKAVR